MSSPSFDISSTYSYSSMQIVTMVKCQALQCAKESDVRFFIVALFVRPSLTLSHALIIICYQFECRFCQFSFVLEILLKMYRSFVIANGIYGFFRNIIWIVVTIIVYFGKIDNTNIEYYRFFEIWIFPNSTLRCDIRIRLMKTHNNDCVQFFVIHDA